MSSLGKAKAGVAVDGNAPAEDDLNVDSPQPGWELAKTLVLHQTPIDVLEV